MLLMIFTGVSYSYWGPIQYTLALACPCFAFAFTPKSKFSKNKGYKVKLFYVFLIAFYVIAISMITQWVNMGAWLFLLSVPNYTELITEFSDLVTPALVGIALYFPLVTVYPFFKWVYFGINDNPLKVRSIWDFRGIDLSNKKEGHGPYTCEVYVCTDDDFNKKIIMPETSRYQSLLVCGGSGTGKTALVYEPLMAKDIERKHIELVKELALNDNGKKINLPNGIIVQKEYDYITLFRNERTLIAGVYPFKSGTINFGDIAEIKVRKTKDLSLPEGSLILDANKVPKNAVWRTRKNGDKFTKFGGGTKPLRSYYIDKKIPNRVRDLIPVLAVEDEIYCIAGIEISDKVKVDNKTSLAYVVTKTDLRQH